MTNTFWKPNRHLTAGFFLISAAGLLFTATLSILLGGPSESALMLGLSKERLILLGGMLLPFTGLIYLGLHILKGKSFPFRLSEPDGKPSRSMSLIIGITTLVFISAWLMTWTPAERFGEQYYYIVRVYPFIVWLNCVSGVGLILLLAGCFGVDTTRFLAFLREQRTSFFVAGATLLVFGLIALAVSFRVVGMSGFEEDFWYGAGVPLLTFQVLLAGAASIALGMVGKKFLLDQKYGKKYWPDLVLFVVIWAIAALLWAREPIKANFFITKPTTPNFQFYPDYDAKFFDLVSQYALIGQGLNNGAFYDRPLYSAMLVYFHAAAGQDYEQVMALQAAVFAIFPALAYLLGKRLHSRAAGAGLAVLFTLRGINAIDVGQLINTANQKHMLTDFPSAILMLILTIILVSWLQDPWKKWAGIGVAGGVLGLATLLRPHPLIYLPILISLVVWVYRKKARVWVTFSTFLLAAALAGVLPWLNSNGQGRSIVDLYLERVKAVIHQRYPDLQLPGDSMVLPSREVASTNTYDLYLPQAVILPPGQLTQKSVLAFSIDNFLNNLTTSVQILPHTPYYQDVQYVVQKSENFWSPYWNGSMSPWAMILLPTNLILVALGIGAAWKRANLSGFVPAIMMLAYYAMNSLARTSGGRYLVPVDWVIIVYYFMGILTLIEMIGAFSRQGFFFIQTVPVTRPQTTIVFDRTTWIKILGVLFLFVMIGALIPLSGSFFQRRYSPLTRKEFVQEIVSRSGKQLNVSSTQFKQFLSAPQAVMMQGRVLYPRQLNKDQGMDISVYNFYHPKPYPRMIFTLIGPNGETPTIFPSVQPVPLVDASDAIILGCRENDYVQVWAVLVTSSNTLIKRTPATPLVCPLPEPVCDNNHSCR